MTDNPDLLAARAKAELATQSTKEGTNMSDDTQTAAEQIPADWAAQGTRYDAPPITGTAGLGYNPPGADLQRDDTITAAIPDWLVPARTKAKATAWNELDARVDAAEAELREARIALANAPSADRAARKAALAAGKAFTGTPAHNKAAAGFHEAEQNMRILNELIREAGRDLINSLRADRAEVLRLTAERLAPAIATARDVVATAQAAIKSATEEVAEAGSGLMLIESLDSNAPDWLGASIPDVPKPDFSKHLLTLSKLESNLGVVETPLKPQFVNVKMHGVVSAVRPESAKMLIGFGGEEVPLYEGTSGLPEVVKPVNGDSFKR